MRSQAYAITVLALSALLLFGCQTRPGYTYRDVMPMYDDFGHARSLTLSTPMVRSTSPALSTIEPWYYDRRDQSPYVTAGHLSLRHEHSVTYTTDRQHIINGRVYDRYDQTTYRRTYRDSTR